jgi:hypothetical protein
LILVLDVIVVEALKVVSVSAMVIDMLTTPIKHTTYCQTLPIAVTTTAIRLSRTDKSIPMAMDDHGRSA